MKPPHVTDALPSSSRSSSFSTRAPGLHATPGFRTGFGFATVQVLLLDANNNVVATQTGSGLGDTFGFDLVARSVQLVFSGHQDPTCGGFSELDIFGDETE